MLTENKVPKLMGPDIDVKEVIGNTGYQKTNRWCRVLYFSKYLIYIASLYKNRMEQRDWDCLNIYCYVSRCIGPNIDMDKQNIYWSNKRSGE